jgi:hypothetical protein
VLPERRRARRYPVSLEFALEGGIGRTVNISSLGVYFETEVPVAAGLSFRLVLPFEYAIPGGASIVWDARVVRVEQRPGRWGVAAICEAIGFGE